MSTVPTNTVWRRLMYLRIVRRWIQRAARDEPQMKWSQQGSRGRKRREGGGGGGGGGEKRVCWDSPDALRSGTLWRSRAIQRAQAGHLQSRCWLDAAAAAARVAYIPPGVFLLCLKQIYKTSSAVHTQLIISIPSKKNNHKKIVHDSKVPFGKWGFF